MENKSQQAVDKKQPIIIWLSDTLCEFVLKLALQHLLQFYTKIYIHF